MAEWSFNSGGTAAARLSSSNVPAGFTVTGLSFNGLTTDVSSGAGFFNAQEGGGSVIPEESANGAAVDYDGLGFGGNNGEQVIFLHRANFVDGAGPNTGDYTSFGPSEGTTADDGDGNAAISFQVTATTEPVVIIGVTARQFGNDALKFGVQEAGAAAGVMATVNSSIATAYLNSPVIVAAGETKTFTISLDSTNGVNTVHNLDYIYLIAGNGLAVGQSSPTADGADIAQLDSTGKTASPGLDAIWGNQPAQGTTFTTGNNASGYELRSFSMQVDADTDARTWSMRTRVVALSSQSDTEVDSVVRDYSEALVYGQFDTDASGNNFITFVFDTPVHLEANRVYGIDMTTGSANGYGFKPYYRSDNPYSGGRAYRAGTPDVGVIDPNSTLAYPDSNRDRVFHLDLEATVGESGSWTAATDRNWDSSTANWTGTTDSLFAAGDLVIFGDTGAGTVTLQENVAPGTVSFANTAGNDYTIASAAAETLSAGGGISLTGAGNVTIDSVIAGGTSIAHSGTGTLTLNGTNTFTGGVTLAAGATLDISGAQSLGDYSQATALTIADGASLIVGSGDLLNDYGVGSIKLSGAGVGGVGAIDFTGDNYSLFNGEWDLLDDTTIDTVGRMDYDGPIVTTGAANVVLTKNGSGRLMVGWDLSGATNLDEVVIAAGELYFETASPDNGSTLIRMQSGTTLARYHTGNSTTNGDFVLEGATLTTSGADNLVYTWSGDLAVTAASTFTTQKTTHTLVTTGALSGAGDIALGDATVRFDGSTSSYTGDVSFSGNSGTVEVNGDYSDATGTLYVASGTTLTGTGTWGGDVVVYSGGTLVDTNLTVNGTVTYESETRRALLGQWTFNDGTSSSERLQSSGTAAGVTLSALAIHPEIGDFGTVNSVPSGDDDGAGYGGNSGEMVLFWHRANYTNDSAPVDKFTTWGVPGVDTGIDTTVANAPMSFTVTAGVSQTVTVEGLLIISSNGTGGCRAHFQEAGQTAGGAHGGWGNSLVPLNEPVVIAPGTTKTFTINWSGDELDIKQNIDRIDLRGTIRTGGAQTTSRTQFSSATGTATPPQGWAFKWNAPSGWVAGVEPGDLSSGAITDTNSWTAMQWGAGVWSADGNSNGDDSSPDKFIRFLGTGGHPGEAGASRDLDRYAIAVYTVDAPGDYQLGQGWIEKASPGGNGLLVKIFSQGQLVKTVKCASGSMAQFEARMEGLSVGDEIAVAVGSAGDPAHDSFEMDFEIVRTDPSFGGLPMFEVAAFGALGDGSTDDFDAIQAAVDAALAAGGGIVRFDGTKTYRIIGNETGDNDVECVFDLEGALNIKIEGNGAELVLHAPDSLAYITYCENIQLDGFTVRFDPLPYYQGTIDAIDVAKLTMDITVPARYVEPEVGTDTAPQSHPFFGRSFIPESPGARAGSGYHLYIDSTETIGGDPRKIRLNFTNGFTNNEGESSNMTDNLQATLNEGATEMVVPHVRYGHRGHHNIVVSHSSRVKVSNILYRNTPFFLCAPVSNIGPVTFSNFDVLTADPANELFVTWRDGFHVKDNAYGLTIEDGDWHGGAMNDDLFNFAHMMKQVTAVSGTELSLVAAASYGGQHIWHAGDWISVWDPTQTILRGRARIVGPGSTATWAATLTLDREIAATVDDWVVNDSRSNRGMLVRDCTNHRLGTRSGSARFRTPAVRFENSHFDGIYFHLHSTTVHEGPVPRDYHFENTYFKGSMGSLSGPINVTAGEDIVFKNCTVDEGSIFGRNGSDLSLDSVDWINQSADVLDLQDGTVGYVYNQSTRNGSEVLLADVSLDSSSLVFFEEARFLQALSPTTGVFPFANLLAIFNDPIQVGSGDIIVRNLTDGIDTRIQTTDTSQVSVIGRELRIDPVADLIAGKDYAVLIEAGALLDEDGVALDGFSSESTWTFTVLDPATANIVLNGDFADNALGFLDTWPGYVGFGGNATSIPEWSYSNTGNGNKGINGDGIHTPFSPSDRSAVTYFAFLQHGSSQFSQDLTGRLAPNSRYRISFKAANRNGDSSALGQVTVGDDSTTFYDSGVQSWSTAAFQSVTAEFTTGASFDGLVQVALRNATDDSEGGVTVNYSDVEIVKIDSYAVWVETYPGLDLSDPNGDLEPDGIPHHMEFALGGHPNVDDADTLMPSYSSDGSSLNFVFRRADVAIGSDYEPYTAYSLNLLDWHPVIHGANGMTLSVNDDGAATGVDEVTVEVDYEQADQDQMFLRLIVP